MTEIRQEDVRQNITPRKMTIDQRTAAILQAPDNRLGAKSIEALRGVWPELSAEMALPRSRAARRNITYKTANLKAAS